MSAIDTTLSTTEFVNETLIEIAKYESQETQNCDSLVEHIKKSITLFREGKVSANHFSTITDALKGLVKKSESNNDTLQKLFTETVSAQPQTVGSSYSTSTVSSVCWKVIAFPINMVYLFWDYFVDGDHPWKMQKYFLGVDGIRTSGIRKGKPLSNSIDLLKVNQTPLSELCLPLLKTLARKKDRVSENMRDLYQLSFVKAFRDLISSDAFQKELELYNSYKPYGPAIDFILQVNKAHYTDILIYTFCYQLVVVLIHEGRRSTHQASTTDPFTGSQKEALSLPLADQFKCIEAAPQALKAPHAAIEKNKLKGATGIAFDPHGEYNIPFAAYKVDIRRANGDKQTVRNIRIGTPTKQYTTEVVPEFQLLIQQLKHSKESYLFVNLQDSRYEGVSSSAEYNRTETIKGLHAKYPETFQLVCFSMDSPFYNQNDQIFEAISFKKAMLEEWTEKDNSGAFFPASWKKDSKLVTVLEQSFDSLHEALFDNAEKLTGAERQIFIDVMIAYLSIRFLIHSEANFFSCVCKDGLDRAGLVNYLVRLLILIIHNKEEDPTLQAMNNVSVHAPTILVKKQAMNGRRERLIQAVDHLMLPKVREKLRACEELKGVLTPWSVFQDETQALWTRPRTDSDSDDG